MTADTEPDLLGAARRQRDKPPTARIGEGLLPLRLEPPAHNEGLQALRFGDGLDELTVQALRHNAAANAPHQAPGTEQALLQAAARRARLLDDNDA